MTETNREQLEIMLVDDDEEWLERLPRLISPQGYKITTACTSYDAIDQLAIRIHEGQFLPDIYLCDMLDRTAIIARRKVTRSSGSTYMEDIYPTIAFNVHNYLTHKGITPEFFVAKTASVSSEDLSVASTLKIPLLDACSQDLGSYFPDVNGLSREEALRKLREKKTGGDRQ